MVQVNRRKFIFAAGGLLATPVIAQQSSRVHTVGMVLRGDASARERYRTILSQRLATHGIVEGRNLRIEVSVPDGWLAGSGREAARRLLAAKVDAILACTDGAAEGARAATWSVPIVFTWVADPIRSGLAAELGRPGGNATGVSTRSAELSVKRVELALELAPGAKRIGMIAVDHWPFYRESILPVVSAVLARAGAELVEVKWNTGSASIEEAFRAGARVVLTGFDQLMFGYRLTLGSWIAKAQELRLPVVYVNAEEVGAGGLMSYGTNLVEDLRRAADMLARVLKGAKPGDMPVDQASGFELAVNLKTARAMGLAIPQSILLRADRVIE
jgi:putative ABC transport system substrate-binding protein